MISSWESCLQPQYLHLEATAHLAINAFMVMLEAAKLRIGIWTLFTNSRECILAIEQILLHDPRDTVRKTAGQVMALACNNISK